MTISEGPDQVRQHRFGRLGKDARKSRRQRTRQGSATTGSGAVKRPDRTRQEHQEGPPHGERQHRRRHREHRSKRHSLPPGRAGAERRAGYGSDDTLQRTNGAWRRRPDTPRWGFPNATRPAPRTANREGQRGGQQAAGKDRWNGRRGMNQGVLRTRPRGGGQGWERHRNQPESAREQRRRGRRNTAADRGAEHRWREPTSDTHQAREDVPSCDVQAAGTDRLEGSDPRYIECDRGTRTGHFQRLQPPERGTRIAVMRQLGRRHATVG